MSIAYTYEIIAVDAQARCMEIVYSAEGHQTMHIGARLPYEGETVEEVVKMFSPVQHWEAQKIPVIVPDIGAKGEITPPAPLEQAPMPTYPVATEPSLIETLPKMPASIL